jgi:hypothetical protein
MMLPMPVLASQISLSLLPLSVAVLLVLRQQILQARLKLLVSLSSPWNCSRIAARRSRAAEWSTFRPAARMALRKLSRAGLVAAMWL